MNEYRWSKPFYGVSHYTYSGQSIRGLWGTIVNHGDYTEAHINLLVNDKQGILKAVREDERKVHYRTALFFSAPKATEEESKRYREELEEDMRSWGWSEEEISDAFGSMPLTDPRNWGLGTNHNQAAKEWVENFIRQENK